MMFAIYGPDGVIRRIVTLTFSGQVTPADALERARLQITEAGDDVVALPEGWTGSDETHAVVDGAVVAI